VNCTPDCTLRVPHVVRLSGGMKPLSHSYSSRERTKSEPNLNEPAMKKIGKEEPKKAEKKGWFTTIKKTLRIG